MLKGVCGEEDLGATLTMTNPKRQPAAVFGSAQNVGTLKCIFWDHLKLSAVCMSLNERAKVSDKQ